MTKYADIYIGKMDNLFHKVGLADTLIYGIKLEAMAVELIKEIGIKQAVIDRLMLEYCPDEMTPEQVEEWGKHQQPCSPELEAQIKAAFNTPPKEA